ncbi:replication-relaxation family protein [Niallia sp. FSL W8-1348]|uniref:replication-relaxation family protein n=1 Tax=Niallia sp. FSL W8-1348 TaxID=2954656 RepID=UPI0030FC6E2B
MRQEKILLSLNELKFATSEHLRQLHSLGSLRNALKVLNQMKEYLTIRKHNGRNVYYLNNLGREIIGAETEIKWSLTVDHHLLRNDMLLYFECPSDWRAEQKITFKYKNGLSYKESTIIPDATFTLHNIFHFLEVDRTQSMSENKKKINQYKLLSPAIEEQFKHKPILVFYTTTESRKGLLEKLCSEVQLENIIISKEDLR